jgi:signal transduction histidine kinase
MSEALQSEPTLPLAVAMDTRILLVDDNEGDRVLCKRHLARSDDLTCSFLEARSAAEALEILSQQRVDCVLLDNYLPDAVGVEVIEQLRIASQDDFLSVVLLTGRGDESIAVEAMQHGANDYLPKSKVSTSVLARAVGNALEKNNLKRLVENKRKMLDETNRELRQRNLEIREFYQTVSHELKTPVTAIREYNALMLEGIGGEVSDDHKDFLSRSITCCDRLTRLINDLLDAARLETGKMQLEMTLTDMTKLLAESTQTLMRIAKSKGITLEYLGGKPLPCSVVDPGRINQVLSNLVDNAIKNTEASGRIVVDAQFNGITNAIEISVTDSGCGISDEDQALIFERYFQVKQHSGDFKEGMGIGLYLCSKIATLHEGSIALASTLGEGSTFTLSLPVRGGQ